MFLHKKYKHLDSQAFKKIRFSCLKIFLKNVRPFGSGGGGLFVTLKTISRNRPFHMTATLTYTLVLAAIYVGRKAYDRFSSQPTSAASTVED